MSPRVDHAGEILRLIDQTLAEEGNRLAELKLVVEQNGTDIEESVLVFGWFHDLGLDKP